METFKKLLVKMPEYYLIVMVLLASFPKTLNFMVFGVIAILILQIVYKNRISGIIIAGLFMLINLYMLAAVVSEFREFQVVNAEAQVLRAVGFAFFVFNTLMAGIMLLKYIGAKKDTRVIPTLV